MLKVVFYQNLMILYPVGLLKKIEYRVIEEVDDQGRIARRVWQDPDSHLPHRIGGPAVEIFDPSSGKLRAEMWFNQARGGRHRSDNLPAERSIDAASGVTTIELYYRDGQMHRDDGGPAEINRDPETGRTIVSAFHLDGKLHREGALPAVQEFDTETGRVTLEEYHRHGRLHRDDGPAIVVYDAEGAVVAERSRYYRDGQTVDHETPSEPAPP